MCCVPVRVAVITIRSGALQFADKRAAGAGCVDEYGALRPEPVQQLGVAGSFQVTSRDVETRRPAIIRAVPEEQYEYKVFRRNIARELFEMTANVLGGRNLVDKVLFRQRSLGQHRNPLFIKAEWSYKGLARVVQILSKTIRLLRRSAKPADKDGMALLSLCNARHQAQHKKSAEHTLRARHGSPLRLR